MADKVTWLTHEFSVYPHNAKWSEAAGVYIFAGTTPKNQWQALYIGQAAKFSERIPAHEKWGKAQSLGATHVHAMSVSQQAMRDQIEAALIHAYQPPLNDQLR